MIEIDTGIDRHLDIQNRAIARAYRETVSGRRTLAIQQCVHDDRGCVGRRLFNPESSKGRKFFALDLTGIDRESPRRETIEFALGDGPKVAGAEEYADFIVVITLVNRRVQSKTCEP